MGAVGLNALALTADGSGVQTYIRELLAAVRRVAPGLHMQARIQGAVGDQLPTGVDIDARSARAGARRAAAGLRPFRGVDVVHGLDVDLPLGQSSPCAITVHDLSVFDTPWAHSRRRTAVERALLARSIRRADVIVAVSPFTAERVAQRFGRSSTVTLLGPAGDMRPAAPADVTALRARLRLPPRFVLQVATVEPRKDTALLAQACADLDTPLVLAGAIRGPVPSGAHTLGYVPRADLAALYGAATVVAYISRYEGFGLPPVEAMACGAPVVASRVGALTDIPGLGAGLVEVGDLDALTARLRELLHDDGARSQLATEGVRAAAGLRWDDAARTTVGIWRDLGATDERAVA
jgi:glycosyltransferase involved in cell wall biosynthesis